MCSISGRDNKEDYRIVKSKIWILKTEGPYYTLSKKKDNPIGGQSHGGRRNRFVSRY